VSTGLHLPTVHRLHPFIKDCTKPKYNLRQRTHQKELISKSVKKSDRHFFVRMLYKDSYWHIGNHTDNRILIFVLCYSWFLNFCTANCVRCACHHTLALPCESVLKATKQVNGKGQNSTPRTPKPLNRSSQKLAGVITSWTARGMQKFCSDRFIGFRSPNTWFWRAPGGD